MAEAKLCKAGCGRALVADPRNKDQKYCGHAECQRARKRDWVRQKRMREEEFRVRELERNRVWRKNHPEYWREYRATHPRYRDHERQRCRRRCHKVGDRAEVSTRRLGDAANVDALTALATGTYMIVPFVRSKGAANIDGILAQVTVISQDRQTVNMDSIESGSEGHVCCGT
jgi:hypothetical protein